MRPTASRAETSKPIQALRVRRERVAEAGAGAATGAESSRTSRKGR